MPNPPDEMLGRISEASVLGQRGDRAEARRVLEQIWDEVDGGDALHRVAFAHAMADVQDDLSDELSWDLQALEAASGVTEERFHATGAAGSVRCLYPSLHLNLADVYARLGDRYRANEHIRLGRSAVDELHQDAYLAIQAALDRIEGQLRIVEGPSH